MLGLEGELTKVPHILELMALRLLEITVALAAWALCENSIDAESEKDDLDD